jgi:hypothetical protein
MLWGSQSWLQPPFQTALSGHARVFTRLDMLLDQESVA